METDNLTAAQVRILRSALDAYACIAQEGGHALTGDQRRRAYERSRIAFDLRDAIVSGWTIADMDREQA